MTLREQIKAIHAKNFSKEFHEYRQNLVPAMVMDLKLKFFDDLLPPEIPLGGLAEYWCLRDTVDVRAVKRASQLVALMALRDTDPAVE